MTCYEVEIKPPVPPVRRAEKPGARPRPLYLTMCGERRPRPAIVAAGATCPTCRALAEDE